MIICVALRTTPKDSGSYMCVATNHFNKTVFTSNSSGVSITVKGWLLWIKPQGSIFYWHGKAPLNNITLSCILFPQTWCQTLTSPSPCQKRAPTSILPWSPVSQREGLCLSPFHYTTGQKWLPMRQLKRERPHLRFLWSWASTWEGSSARQTMEIGLDTVGWFP